VTGVEVVERVREQRDAPVRTLVITGSTSGELADALRRAGLMRLQKPVSPARLRAALDQLFRAGQRPQI
jgi:CheY-like chemotaxis protein